MATLDSHYNNEEILVSLHDVARIFLYNKVLLISTALYCALFGLFYSLTKPLEYEITSTFKEQGDIKTEGALKDFKEALGLTFDVTQTSIFMKSQHILHPIVSRLGLQVQQVKKRENIILGCRRALLAEFHKKVPDLESVRFRDVVYEGEDPRSFQLMRIDDHTFEISTEEERKQGTLGELISLGNHCSLYIDSIPKGEQNASFEIHPWTETVEDLRTCLLIKPHKQNRSLYVLTLKWPDRFLGTELVNGIMEQYQTFLREEYDQRINLDLAYLQRRQNDLVKEFEMAMRQHQTYLQNNIDTQGYLYLKQELEEVAKPYRELFLRSCSIEVEEKQLLTWGERDSPFWLGETPIGSHLNRLHLSLEDLFRERDQIQTVFHVDSSAIDHEELLRHVRRDLQAVTIALAEPISEWKDLELRNHSHLLSIREKILMERSEEPGTLDLGQARHLLGEQGRSLEEFQSSKEKMLRLLDQMNSAPFETLSPLLPDEISQRLLSRIGEAQLHLNDTANYSQKEKERAERTITEHRDLLSTHVQRLIEGEELQAELCQEKITLLQKKVLDGLQCQISILREQITDLIRQRIDALKQEQLFLKRKMEDLREKMRLLPDKWFSETLLTFQTDIRTKLIQAVNQLVETKMIGSNLYHIASKPLDTAVSPRFAKKPQIILYSAGAAFAGSLLMYLFLFAIGLIRGLPFGVEKLKGLRFSGFLGRSQDREVVKKAFLALQNSRSIGVIMGQGPDLSVLLPEYVQRSRKPLDHSDSLSLLQCEGIIVTLCDEKTEILLPYLNHPNATFLKL